jgi:hypothetical protein
MHHTNLVPVMSKAADQEESWSEESAAEQQSGRWRRKAALAGTGVGLALLMRRLRSRSTPGPKGASNGDGSTNETDGRESGSGLFRKIGAFVAIMATVLLLRKRFRRGSNP